ncbi:hypothetical protein F5Y07DRAFT_329707 [Xylaria sp. FL0933]|nr:hypothetical protein F5Y07DRAFT_329707 [Xylaria sp. FL0933]
MNNRLLPPLVPTTCTIGFLLLWIAWITACCSARNAASTWPIIWRSRSLMSVACSRRSRLTCAPSVWPLKSSTRLLFRGPANALYSAPNLSTRCHWRLMCLNCNCCNFDLNGAWPIFRLYLMCAVNVVWPACRSTAWS